MIFGCEAEVLVLIACIAISAGAEEVKQNGRVQSGKEGWQKETHGCGVPPGHFLAADSPSNLRCWQFLNFICSSDKFEYDSWIQLSTWLLFYWNNFSSLTPETSCLTIQMLIFCSQNVLSAVLHRNCFRSNFTWGWCFMTDRKDKWSKWTFENFCTQFNVK